MLLFLSFSFSRFLSLSFSSLSLSLVLFVSSRFSLPLFLSLSFSPSYNLLWLLQKHLKIKLGERGFFCWFVFMQGGDAALDTVHRDVQLLRKQMSALVNTVNQSMMMPSAQRSTEGWSCLVQVTLCSKALSNDYTGINI